jgi:predicted nucleic acid-binding protein
MRMMIDSGALLALVDRGDTHHTAAAQFLQTQHTASYVVPETIFAETMTLVKARLGAQPAITLGERLMHSHRFTLLPLSDVDRERTWHIFSRYTDKAWSYVDCSVLAVALRLAITDVFAFDHHFDQMAELRRVPNAQVH